MCIRFGCPTKKNALVRVLHREDRWRGERGGTGWGEGCAAWGTMGRGCYGGARCVLLLCGLPLVREEETHGEERKEKREKKKREKEKNKVEIFLNLEILGEKNKR
jgi:hypothetical protein